MYSIYLLQVVADIIKADEGNIFHIWKTVTNISEIVKGNCTGNLSFAEQSDVFLRDHQAAISFFRGFFSDGIHYGCTV